MTKRPLDLSRCPHMSGDAICTTCRTLIAYRICWEGLQAAMEETKQPPSGQAMANLMSVTFNLIFRLCMEDEIDVQEAERAFESITRAGKPDNGSGTDSDQPGPGLGGGH